jgi:hypothetical protein
MPNYSKGKVYKIVAETDEEYKPYIGSTIEQLSARMASHRCKYFRFKDKKSNQSKCGSFELFDRFGIEKCCIILIEDYSCENVEQLRARERYWFDNIPNCNNYKPIITPEEAKQSIKLYQEKYNEEHKDYISERSKKYYIEHKKEILEKQAKKFDCECGGKYSYKHKTRHERSNKHQEYLATL